MIEVRYETPDGIVRSIKRSEIEKNGGYLECYDNPDDQPGLENRIDIPRERIVEILY